MVRGIIDTLPYKQAQAIRMNFGIDTGKEGMTLEAIGNEFGVTREAIRLTLLRAMKKLRHRIKQTQKQYGDDDVQLAARMPRTIRSPILSCN